MTKVMYLPTYGLGSWLKDNMQGVMGGLKTAAGIALTATGAGAGVGVPLIAGGVGDIAGEIHQDKVAKLQEQQQSEQMSMLQQSQLAQNRLNTLQTQPQMQFRYGGRMYPDGGSVTTQYGTSTPYYRNITPTTFTQQLMRKNILQAGSDTLSVPQINAQIREGYNIPEGYSLPYRALEQDGKTIYQKDFGRKSGEFYDPSGTGKVVDTYNEPRVTYAYGGKIKNLPQGKATLKEAREFQKQYPEEMAMGRKVEYEHTKNANLADRIAADHIKDFLKMSGTPKYYTGLKQAGLTDELKNGGNLKKETMYKPNMTYYANGGTHESNPRGGIQIGDKGFVEEGEFRYGDYIFSNRF